MICKECKVKSGYKFNAAGTDVVRKLTCDDCGEKGLHWPDRHFVKVEGKSCGN